MTTICVLRIGAEGGDLDRLIVDEHHGRISVQSPPGVGTTVTVRLPYEDN